MSELSQVEEITDRALEEPTEATFWREYSPRYEFPISLVGSIFIVAIMFVMIALIIYYSTSSNEGKTSVPIMAVDGGFDDAGEGKEGGGGIDNPSAIGDFSPTAKDYEALPQYTAIPDVKEDIKRKILIDDPNGTIAISDEKAAQFASLSESLRNKVIGAQKGTGGGPGNGDGPKQDGNGGTGASSARQRSLRWILRFSTVDGRDYLRQLGGIGAVILIPIPPENNRAYIFRNLANPKAGEFVGDNEWKSLDNQIRFCDVRRDSVQNVSTALGLDFTPNSFWAYFPRGFEDDLSRKEQAYNNRKPEDIDETVFTVVMRDGSATISVAKQTLKR